MPTDLIRKYSAPVPRYTSYPTAPHFNSSVDNGLYREWLTALPADAKLSLYFHIPYCDRLCWFCGCHTKQTNRYQPVERYLESLFREIETVGGLLDGRGKVNAIHLGGGSPTLLLPEDLLALRHAIDANFTLTGDAQVSVEIDPNDITPAKLGALARFGVNRASLGVQDFDPDVQAAINRPQSFADTKRVVEGLRKHGIGSVNLDVLYGLPLQTEQKLEKTIAQVLSLEPDRIALFGYAHVPWVKKHQTMIPEDTLPGTEERFAQASGAARQLTDAGYRRIGLDHFARPDDAMARASAEGELKRNFQGYTVDPADALLGFGASAIGRLPQGYVQNVVATGQYEQSVDAQGLGVAKGFILHEEDRVRGWVIERLMCDLSLSYPRLREQFGAAAAPVIAEAHDLASGHRDGFVRETEESLEISEAGRPFVRTIAAAFDTYLGNGAGRHSAAV